MDLRRWWPGGARVGPGMLGAVHGRAVSATGWRQAPLGLAGVPSTRTVSHQAIIGVGVQQENSLWPGPRQRLVAT